MTEAELKIPKKNWIKNRRKNASAKLDSLLRRQKYRCHWCEREIVRLAHVQTNYRITKQTNACVTFVGHDGRETRKLIATVDHLLELTTLPDRPNDFRNIVAACKTCNARHSQGVDMTNRVQAARGGI